ncbi:MAG: hypothetical protein PUG00_04235 [Clostridiales bacterium]|nr:hypothetical protein [Clostridiales bacterium]
MSTGISMSSVNKIKELADNGDYSLALDILEHQDLSKSLSPQFIRICGEVYYENKRYADARAALVKAHSMAPAGNKIIYSIIKLYLSMGFRKLAEHYYEIYKFNQNNKDVGTYRIEYMIAKAYKKPVNELYSILISANEMEADEEWEFEMLLLHAFIRNKEKYNSACVEFRANYRNSSRLYMLDELMDGKNDLESMIYCFPYEDKIDDDPEQENTRKMEENVLAEDDLKMHPKDAKIMIMVEDDAPVSSSMKFKQMWIRSRDRKEQKKEQKREEQEEAGDELAATKKSRGFWGIMSRKEESLVDQEMQEIQNEQLSKEQLIGEIVEDSQKTDTDEQNVKSDAETDNAAEVHDDQSTENEPVSDKLDEDDLEQEDNFVLEEEPEEVVMVDIPITEEPEEDYSDSDSDVLEAEKVADEDARETFDPEFAADEDEEFNVVDDPDSISVDDTFFAEEDETPSFDFDKAFESLEEFEVEPEIEDISDVQTVDPEIQSTDAENEESEDAPADDIEDIESDEIESETDAIDYSEEPESGDAEPEMADEPDESESENIELEEINEPAEFESGDSMSEEYEIDESDLENGDEQNDADKSEIYIDTDELQQEEFQVEDYSVDDDSTEDIEVDTEVEESFEDEDNDIKEHKPDFPIFKSSLFPDYNTENAFLYDIHDTKKADIAEDEIKINENLKKEEDLIGETDRLLARLGIKFNTEFKSILEFDDEEDSETDMVENEPERKPDEDIVETVSDESASEDVRKEGVKKSGKKPFRLKGTSK